MLRGVEALGAFLTRQAEPALPGLVIQARMAAELPLGGGNGPHAGAMEQADRRIAEHHHHHQASVAKRRPIGATDRHARLRCGSLRKASAIRPTAP
ncbi:hypothetical protein NITHO_4790017 [Nitrolancea hollandica Lb]|uniref:Uncharacterized protein n=1 Tax=Nitrolancea hollandica Lb TaxID=1129897 RepID=I4EKT9_9BACT|nr:hypothetical protein NITHO_4790017 [Nitrolancea hollandica Lb]